MAAISDIAAAAWTLWDASCIEHGVDPKDRRIAPRPTHLPRRQPGGFEVSSVAQLAERYLDGLPQRDRAAFGRYYTPPAIARVLAERAIADVDLESTSGLIIDPACGAGSLLAAVVDCIVAAMPAGHAVEHVACRVRGTDLDGVAADLCDLAIRIAILPAWSSLADSARPPIPRLARIGDGLEDRRPAALVIANPPFGRTRLDADRRRRHAEVLYGHAHLPTLFLHASTLRTTPGGVVAFVLPASLVGGAYYQRLRAFLVNNAPPNWLAFIRDRSGVFSGGVLQEALLATFVRDAISDEVCVERISANGAVEREMYRARLDEMRPSMPWLLPRCRDDVALLDEARAWRGTLTGLGWSVSTGPLVWNRHKGQLHAAEGPDRLPVIWGSDLRNGRVDVSLPRAGRYVEVADEQSWLVLTEPAVLVQRTTAPEQSRRLVAAILDERTLQALGGAVVVENHLNVCTWNRRGAMTPRRLYRFLMSEKADRLYRCMTGSVAVSAFELEALPVPHWVEPAHEAA